MFQIFKAEVENQLDRKIKVVRSNRDGEYYGKYNEVGHNLGPFVRFLQDNGIITQYTVPGMPRHYGVAKRRNRTLLNMFKVWLVTQVFLGFCGVKLSELPRIF